MRASNWQVRKLGGRLAANTIIQGTAADIIKVAMVRCYNALEAAGLQTRCILQIHDELLFEGPPEEMEQATEIVTREMVARRRAGPAADGRRGRRRTGSPRSSLSRRIFEEA